MNFRSILLALLISAGAFVNTTARANFVPVQSDLQKALTLQNAMTFSFFIRTREERVIGRTSVSVGFMKGPSLMGINPVPVPNGAIPNDHLGDVLITPTRVGSRLQTNGMYIGQLLAHVRSAATIENDGQALDWVFNNKGVQAIMKHLATTRNSTEKCGDADARRLLDCLRSDKKGHKESLRKCILELIKQQRTGMGPDKTFLVFLFEINASPVRLESGLPIDKYFVRRGNLAGQSFRHPILGQMVAFETDDLLPGAQPWLIQSEFKGGDKDLPFLTFDLEPRSSIPTNFAGSQMNLPVVSSEAPWSELAVWRKAVVKDAVNNGGMLDYGPRVSEEMVAEEREAGYDSKIHDKPEVPYTVTEEVDNGKKWTRLTSKERIQFILTYADGEKKDGWIDPTIKGRDFIRWRSGARDIKVEVVIGQGPDAQTFLVYQGEKIK